MSPNAVAARDYATRGWRPLVLHGINPTTGKGCTCRLGPACGSSGKHPVDLGWQKAGPLTDFDGAWSGWRSSHNVGLATGAASGFFVLDVDNRDSLARLEAAHGGGSLLEVAGWAQETGSGGLHLAFAMPDSFEPTNRRGGLAVFPGLDVRGTGGQIVAAPSRNAAGAYRVLKDGKPQQAPEWLLTLLRPVPPASPAPAVTAPHPDDDDRLRSYTRVARDKEVARLTAMAEAAGPDYQGEPWDATTHAVACNLLELANSPWANYSRESALADVRQHAPRDEGFTSEHIEAKIRSALTTVGTNGRAYPAERVTLEDEVRSWSEDPDVRVDPAVQQPAAAPVAESEHDDSKASAATQLVRLAESGYTFGQSAEGEPFALPKVGPQVPRMFRGGQDSLRAELAEQFFRRTGKAPSQSALTDALGVLDGMASKSAPVELTLRVAEVDGAVWLDIGDSTGRAIRVDPRGWEVCEQSPTLPRRTPLTGTLPEPERGGSLNDLWALLNVSPADRPVVAAVLVAALLPDIPHPVVIVDGEQGSGKSSACRLLGGLLDPSPVPLRKPPSNVDGWTTAAAGSWVVAVDNVSTLQPWFSDALCRAATGDGDVQRRLYTNGDLFVVAFRRVVILNGIDLAGIRDDLADRAVTVHLERLAGRYRDEAELGQAWAAAHPRVLGGLLDLAVAVLGVRPSVVLTDAPRMVDFARVLAAVDLVLGTDGMARYRALSADLAADAVTGDPVLAAVVERIRQEWTGTAGDLLDLLSYDHIVFGVRPPREWPADARAMSAVLRRRAPSLRRLGWAVDDLGRGGRDKQLRWRLSPPSAAGIGGHQAGIGGRQTGIAAPHARPPAGALTCEDASSSPLDGHDGRQDARLSSLSSQEERQERAADTSLGEVGLRTPAMPAMPVWDIA